jgi:hypothetical protein
MTPAQIERETKAIGALHCSYAEWIYAQFQRWPEKTWRDEYARPVFGPYPMSPPDSAWAAARHARGLAKILNHRGP